MQFRMNTFGCIFFWVIPFWSGLAQTPTVLPNLKQKVEKFSANMAMAGTSDADPVSVDANLVWSQDRSQLAIVLKAVLHHQWHIYAYVPEDQPYIASELKLELPLGIKPVGDWDMPPSEPYESGILTYQGELVFVQYCEVQNVVKEAKVDVGLYYQACDPYKCYPPETKSKELHVHF